MDVVKDTVIEVAEGSLEVPRSDVSVEAMLSYDSCFGVLYSETNEICQEQCNLPVVLDGEEMQASEACAGVNKKVMNKLKEGGDFVCEMCNQPFVNKGAYVRHMKAKHNRGEDTMRDKIYSCDYCDKERGYEIAVDFHEALVHGD